MNRIGRMRREFCRWSVGLSMLASLVPASLTGAKAADELPTESVLPVSLAMRALQASLARCEKEGHRIGISIVDRSGVVRAVARGDGAPPHTIDSSRKKAYTAVGFRRSTTDIVAMLSETPALRGLQDMNEEVLALGGGLPIVFAGEVVGGIGVAGAPGGHLDDACAQAGLDAIEALPKVPSGN
ncbi:heme-binding protein [Neorhizobium sp. T7_12]|uniref:GlcG/HbpS family heme-binding protein n=1 Tax=Neorhizobium sp. T7_12 TaxID=2093832 RepID=UPI000CF92515|nr:heme-binding protein [Neorhizobium sp. T7_12]